MGAEAEEEMSGSCTQRELPVSNYQSHRWGPAHYLYIFNRGVIAKVALRIVPRRGERVRAKMQQLAFGIAY